MDSAQRDASKEHIETHTEATINDDHHLPVHGNVPENEKDTSSSSSSTSSDGSSEEDFFQLDPIELNKALSGSNDFSSQNGEITRISQSSNNGRNTSESGYMFTSHGRPFSPDVSGANAGPETSIFATRQYPPRNDVPDPNRIPSSIFERSKSSTPMEWSVASNESLFSIHVGNSSFSRDHVILLGRSGDLGNMPPMSPLYKSTELTYTPPISPIPPSSPNIEKEHMEDMDVEEEEEESVQTGTAETAAANAEAMSDVLRAAADEHADKDEPLAEKAAFLSASISHRSDGSGTSFRSFAFPILTGEGRSGSMKVEPEPQKMNAEPVQHHSSDQKEAPASGNKWFPCFSCCSFCC